MLLDTPVCDFGWRGPDFELKDFDGVTHRLADYLGNPAILVAFICNHCPYVQRIARDFADQTRALKQQGIPTLAIMSNDYRDYPADAPPRMAEFAKTHKATFPYLVDENQAVGQAWGAVCTPDFFGLDSQGRLQYRGRFQDPNPTGGDGDELFQAMRQIAHTGKGPTDQMPSVGCSIKWTH